MKNKSLRVLIPTVTCGGGHLQAATALEEAWCSMRPKDTVERLDVLDFTSKLYRKVYAEGYVKLIEHAPELYGHYFTKTDDPRLIRKMTPLRRITARLIAHKFIKHLRKFKPDLILAPHFLPLEIMGSLKAGKDTFHPKTVCVVTDYEAHALWLEPCVDLYCVATEATKARLVVRDIPEKKVAVTGIPISARFSAPLNRKGLQAQFGLRPDLPTLLVLGGGFGMGPLPKIVASLDKTRRTVQIVVVAGRNEEMRKKLALQDYRNPVRVLGFVKNMQEWMAVSDLIVTKPGGLTTSESLAMGKPLLVINPIPGQEAANSDFLLEQGAASKVNRVEDLTYRMEKLLEPGYLNRLGASAKALGRPDAGPAVCRAALRLMRS